MSSIFLYGELHAKREGCVTPGDFPSSPRKLLSSAVQAPRLIPVILFQWFSFPNPLWKSQRSGNLGCSTAVASAGLTPESPEILGEKLAVPGRQCLVQESPKAVQTPGFGVWVSRDGLPWPASEPLDVSSKVEPGFSLTQNSSAVK